MEYINLTPHTLNIIKADGEILTLPPSGTQARIEETYMSAGSQDGIEIFFGQLGEIVGLPEDEENVIFVVPKLVAQKACRRNVYSPGRLVRDEEGRPIGCRGLQRHA